MVVWRVGRERNVYNGCVEGGLREECVEGGLREECV